MTVSVPLRVDYAVDPEDRLSHLALSPDFGLVGVGPTPLHAFFDLRAAIETHLARAVDEGRVGELFRDPPAGPTSAVLDLVVDNPADDPEVSAFVTRLQFWNGMR